MIGVISGIIDVLMVNIENSSLGIRKFVSRVQEVYFIRLRLKYTWIDSANKARVHGSVKWVG